MDKQKPKKDNRPLGSRDWNHDGKYDLFDKITDRYIYAQVMKDSEEQDKKDDMDW